MKRVFLVLAVLLGVFAFMTGAMAEGEDGAAADETVAVSETSAVVDETAPEEENDAATSVTGAVMGVTVVVDGTIVDFDVAPQIENGRIIVPLRAVFEIMGAVVEWDNDTQTVTATKGDTVVVLTIGDICPTVNGEIVEIDQPAIIVSDRTLAPLRFVAEAFGGDVEWDGDLRAAFITIPKETEEVTEPNETNPAEEVGEVTKLLYQGHGSYRITAQDGTVIYVDPYVGDGYDVPADIILVTHQHSDHNNIALVTQKADCTLISNVEALAGGKHNSFTVGNIKIEAVTASNSNHDPKECVGYLITVDGILIYAAGDTSKTDEMATYAAKKIDYALLPCDGVYNMGLEEAAECAELIGAKHNIPIHMIPGSLFDRSLAEQFNAPNRLIVEPGQEITL